MTTASAAAAHCRSGATHGKYPQPPQHPTRDGTVRGDGCDTQVIEGRNFSEGEARIGCGVVAEQQCTVCTFQNQLVRRTVSAHHKKVLDRNGLT
ncbi:hypothetical protein PSSY5922_30455 [Pseudomonas synxantha]